MGQEWRVVSLAGDLCIAELPAVRHQLDDAIADGTRHLMLDLAGTTLLTAAALRVIDTTEHRLLVLGGDLRLRNPEPLARRVLEITGFDRLLEPLAA